MIIHIKMSEVQVEVRNAAGDLIGSFFGRGRISKVASSDAEGARRKEDRSLYRRPTHNRFAFADVSAPSWELRSYATEVRAHTPSSKKASRGLRSLEGSVKSCARCCACCSPIKFYPSSIQVLS